jgi:anthranilate phosphoribosyltransferase
MKTNTLFQDFITKPEFQTPETIQKIAAEIMDNKLTSAQIGGFLVALKILHLEIDPQTVHAVAQAMRDAAIHVSPLPYALVDIGSMG